MLLSAIAVFLSLILPLNPVFAQDKIVAIVNNDVITQKDLNDFLNFMRVQLSSEYSGKELEEKLQSVKLDTLNRLIEDRLILQQAKKSNLRIDENRIKARLNEIRSRYRSEDEFQSSLAKQGLVLSDVEKKLKDQFLMFALIETKIKSKIIINPREVTEFYKQNIKEFTIPETREFLFVVLDDQNMAKDIYSQLKKGANLQSLSQEHSLVTDKLVVSQDRQLKPEIQEAVLNLKLGTASAPVLLDGKFYIFELNSLAAASQQSFSKVKDKVYAYLFDKKMQESLDKWLEEIKNKSYIKVMQSQS